MTTNRAGGEVDAWCTRCGFLFAHTIVAMDGVRIARVLCNTCKTDHAYRTAAPGEGRAAPRAWSAPPDPPPSVVTYEEKLKGRDEAAARAYGVKDVFKVDDLVRHPVFGLGIVAAVKELQKIEVMFRTDVKVLLHNKGGAPPRQAPPRLAQEPPSAEGPAVNEENSAAPTADD